MGTTSSTIAIIGAGRVGRAIAGKLRQAGWHILGVVTRSNASARRAVRQIGAGKPYGGLTRLILDAGVLLIAVPDDSISTVAKRLARIGGEELQGKVVLHTSGALDRRALVPLEEAGASTGSVHPMQSFSTRFAPSLDGVHMVIEGAPGALRVARKIVRELGGVPVRLRDGQKETYHAAGVFAAAHVLAMVEAGTRALTIAGFPRRQAEAALLRLSRQVLSNFQGFGPAVAWSGPLARGDFGTIAGNMRALKKFPREFAEAYAAASRLGARVLARRPKTVLAKLESALRAGAKKFR